MQDAYFQQLTQCLQRTGNGLVQLIIDMQRYQHNLDHIKAEWPVSCTPRLVVKSLANLQLIALAMQRLNTHALMVFHLPHVLPCFQYDEQADILLGKPMPIQAVATAFSALRPYMAQIQWLIDSPTRLKQYLDFAVQTDCCFHLHLEIDVGLHRGGFQSDTDFEQAVRLILAHPQHLKLSGLMGYDVHVAKLPAPIFQSKLLYQASQQRYADFIQRLQKIDPALDVHQLSLNGAGSQTLVHHFQQTVCNDLSFGSALLKPTDFSVPQLQQVQPALWIASPILKRIEAFQLPGLEPLTRFKKMRAICIYGGYWRGECVYPRGAKPHPLYGRSSNQELWQLPKHSQLTVDDYIFFQPAQSEATIQQFEMAYFYQENTLKAYANLRE